MHSHSTSSDCWRSGFSVSVRCLRCANCHGHMIEAMYKLLCPSLPEGYLCPFLFLEAEWLLCTDFLIVASSHAAMPWVVPSLFIRILVYIIVSSSYVYSTSVVRDARFPYKFRHRLLSNQIVDLKIMWEDRPIRLPWPAW